MFKRLWKIWQICLPNTIRRAIRFGTPKSNASFRGHNQENAESNFLSILKSIIDL